MMGRVIWLAPILVITTLLAVYGFRWGYIVANITETDVISGYAAVYLEEHGIGARLSDCAGFPGNSAQVWIVVRCHATGDGVDRVYEYHANRLGGLEYSGPPKGAADVLGEDDV